MKRMPRELSELAKRMAAWRDGGGGRGQPIPDEIWAEAIRISRTAGLWPTSRVLRLNYQDLKKRAAMVTEREAAESSAPIGTTSVVSFDLAQITGADRTVIEIVGRYGDRMRVEAPGNIDLASVVQAFGCRS